MPLTIDSIDPTAINAVVGQTVEMSVEASGGATTPSLFFNDADAEQCLCLTEMADGSVLAGFGTTANVDCKVLKKTGGTVTTYMTLANQSAISSLYTLADGSVLAGSDNSFVNGDYGIYKNGNTTAKLLRTANTGKFGRFWKFHQFDNGNIIALEWSDQAIIWLSTDNGETWSAAHTESGLTMFSVCEINGATALVTRSSYQSGNNTKILKSTDSGATWANTYTGSGYQRAIVNSVSATKLALFEEGVGWKQSTDSGSSWVGYVGAPPASNPYSASYDGGMSSWGEFSVARCYLGTSDAGFTQYDFSGGYSGVLDVRVLPSGFYAGTYGGAGAGDAWIFGERYTKTLRDTSDNSVLSTVSPYTFTADTIYNGTNFKWSVTDGVTTVLSALIPVTVTVPVTDGSNKLVQGATEVSIFSRYGYKTEIAMRMDKTTDSRGIVRWLDDGRDYDSYKTELQVRTTTPLELEALLCDDSTDALKITTPNTLGLFPFTPIYATGYDYPISVVSWKTGGDAVIGGEVVDYELSIVPAVRGVYDAFPKATDLGGCIVSAWQIGAVDFPFSDWEPEINDYRRVIELNGNNSELVDTTRTYGDIAKIKVNCSEEQARRILSFFVSTMRGSEQTATFPDSYHIFGRRYSGMTTCKVRLYEPILTVSHTNYESVDIEFTLQMVGV